MAKTNLNLKKGSLVRLILDESGSEFLGVTLKKVSHKSIDEFLPGWVEGIQSGRKIWHVYDIEDQDLLS